MKKEFSKEQIESIKLLYSKNYSLQKIIQDLNLNCCEPTLIKCLKELGLYDSNRKGKSLNTVNKKSVENFEEDILKPWLNGVSLTQLNKLYKMSKVTMSNKLKKLGYEIKNNQTQVILFLIKLIQKKKLIGQGLFMLMEI